MIDQLTQMLVFDKIYWYLAIPFTVLLVIQLIGTFAGIGSEDDFDSGEDGLDIGEDGDCESGFQVFTIKNFITFFSVFGWAGLTFSHAGLGQFTTIVLSTILGIFILFIVSSLFYFTTKLTDNGTMNMQRAKGVTGEVYIPIPPKRNGVGKVNVTFEGAFRELDAMTDEEDVVPTGTMIVVKDIIGNSILLVEKVNKGDVQWAQHMD
ncbi:hypothetical protein [Inediibacterium massiliense]|uniref:hypothetical protein n=1 Tax=Inediibacterium massiliense TaxID=1658111 RepID=UPI0006B61B62|nr:hypothetical protein [Inediibacterium massiliense]